MAPRTDSPLDRLPLACPHDRSPLLREGNTLRCPSGHAFDLARQGYVHLLPVALKASRSPGDSASMVAARRAVLDSGLFAPLARALGEAVREVLPCAADAPPATIVDAGAGEGYYTDALAGAVPKAALLGVDIAKPAVLAAARRYPSCAFAVATNRCLPILSGRADLIVCLFGFPAWAPWAALQTARQAVVTVDPAAAHLLELRERIYERVRQRPAPRAHDALAAGYAIDTERSIRYRRAGVPCAELLDMTPHGRRVTAAARDAVLRKSPDLHSVDVTLRVYRRLATTDRAELSETARAS